jgi:sodium/proline symporter
MVSRIAVICIAFISFLIAFLKISSIYNLVLYAWSGLGASFGPLVLYCLYSNKPQVHAAWTALISGASLALFWPLIAFYGQLPQEPLLPSFAFAFFMLFLVDRYSRKT